MEGLFRDLRAAGRALFKHPGFAAATVVTLALGLGGNTGLFALVHGILVRPLPYPESASLVFFHWQWQGGTLHACPPAKFLYWGERSRSFASLSAYQVKSSGATLLAGAGPEYVGSLPVSADFFRTLGVRPALGRDFLAAEDAPGGEPVAILSHDLWRRSFGADPSAVGRSVRLGDRNYAIVGVMPAGFAFEPAADLWTPLRAAAEAAARGNTYAMLGRLAPGVSRQRAQEEADGLFATFQRESPLADPGEAGVALGDFKAWVVGDTRGDLLLLWSAGGLVFLICCINLSSLLAARLASREGEIAIRLALGGDRRQVLRAAAAEHLLLVFAASIAGWAVARGVVAGALALSPYPLPRAHEVRVGAVEALFAAAAALVAVVLVGAVPTLRALRLEPGARLRALAGERGGAVGGPRRRLGKVLVVAEVALSLAVLVAAWDLVGGFLRLRAADPGFRAENVLTFKVPLAADRYRSSRTTVAFTEELRRRLGELPGVVAAAAVTNLPLETGLNVPVYAEASAEAGDFEAEYRAVGPEYFAALGIPVRGRAFGRSDGADAAAVAVVNATLARRAWGVDGTLGRTLWIARGLGALSDRPREVVGVAEDIRDLALGAATPPTVYVPQAQVPDALAAIVNGAFPLSWVVRLERPGAAAGDLRRLVREVDPHHAVASVRPLADIVAGSTVRERFYASLLALLAGLALWLTLLGVYGVTAQAVSHRRHEMGLRMAIGADRRQVRTLVLREVGILTLLGIGLGVPLAFGLNRLVGGLVVGAQSEVFGSLAAAGPLVLVVALAASYLPARAVTRIDPAAALRG
jgi:predicted permease